MRHPARLLPVVLLLLATAAPAARASITGVCPDGSIFIVQDRARIPCAEAKEVAPSEVPPVRPEYLPRPYSWQVYRERVNPNNPYNLIDAARRVRALEGNVPAPGTPPVGTTDVRPRGFAQAGPAPPGVSAPPAWATPARPAPSRTLALPEAEVRDLFLIVELSQQAAPVRFLKEDARGQTTVEVSFAWSAAFEARAREALAPGGGPIVLFTVLAHGEDDFHPNFTFVQGHESFHPNADDPAQLGILEGRPGELAAEDVVLGYVVLPDRMDPGRTLSLYWNDRRIEAVLRP